MDTLAFAKEGGDSGPALVAGNKSESILLERIHLPAEDEEIMPPKNGPLTAQQKTFSIAGSKQVPSGRMALKVRNENFFCATKRETNNLYHLQLILRP